MSPTEACTNITRTFGVANRSKVPTMGPSSSRRVRESKRGTVASGATTSLRNPTALSVSGIASPEADVPVDINPYFATAGDLRLPAAALRASVSTRVLPAERHARRRGPRHGAVAVGIFGILDRGSHVRMPLDMAGVPEFPALDRAAIISLVVTIAWAKVGPLISCAACIASRLKAAVASFTRVTW